jgi:MFS family permease
MSNVSAASGRAGIGFFDRQNTIAKAGFNRWLVPPCALAIHLCIGMAYGFSVFWVPLGRAVAAAKGLPKPIACPGDATSFFGKLAITGHALFATDCDWTQFDLGWMYTLFFVLLGSSAAIWGGWVEREGPRKAGVVAAFCWAGGLVISAFGVYIHQLWLMWLGSGVIGGIGLGLGYISPVSTLVKWFPDRRGMATGMAIMGFGGGAMIGAPLASVLMNYFRTPTDVGVWQTFLVLALIYFIFMIGGALSYRLPPANWAPDGLVVAKRANAMITHGNINLKDAHKTPQFWLVWLVLCMNVSAGIGVIGAAAPMLQETFGGHLFGHPDVGFAQFTDEQRKLAGVVSAGFVGLFSLFNIVGRFFWASLSDYLGRKTTYYAFFILGILCYGSLTTFANLGALPLFGAVCCIIASMYGGGFSTVPAYIADLFGVQYVGAIHGRILTAWSTAGIIGPVLVNYLHDARVAEGVPRDHVYDAIFYALTALLVVGLIANALVRPVAEKWFMGSTGANEPLPAGGPARTSSQGIDFGRFDAEAAIGWALVGIPLAWGFYITLSGAVKLFQ